MLRVLILIVFIFSAFSGYTSPRVPGAMEFAGIKLTINEAARQQIQDDVDALHRNQTYFNRKLEKVDMYFPIIERVFREENVPEDFKYLVIQESALISDAVSSSNAVGFWQFKEGTAREVGLIVDRQIDERMNITASSHGAAKYLKKNNFFFDNWVYALLAYNTGPGGAEKHVEQKYMGAGKMAITRQTHWYVKKFLAHKIAFEDAIGKNNNLETKLYEYKEVQNKSLRQISDYFRIDYQLLSEYNKWIKRGSIPADKSYTVVLPVSSNDKYAINLLSPADRDNIQAATRPKIVFENNYKPVSEFNFNETTKYPIVKTSFITKKVKINGIPGFIASSKDKLSTVTIDHGITQKKFMKYNEITPSEEIKEGQVYYLKPKKSKAKIHYHVVIPGESAWSISQKYGIKLKKLLSKNRMYEEKQIEAGMVVWMRFIRPADQAIEYRKNDAKNLIVTSESNEISHPEKYPIHDRPDKELVTEKASEIPEETSSSEGDEDFLFEELDNETEFINENSYINLTTVEELEGNGSTNTGREDKSGSVPEKGGKKTKKYHMVNPGETLFSISRMYDVSIGEIRQWNDISDLDVLSIGQKIVIYHDDSLQVSSEVTSDPVNNKTYVVKKNDTLYSIARTNGMTIKELMDLNEKEDFIISEGEILKIGSTQ
jgi:membrane-bound lytic murein transglycosylase D